MGLGLILSYGLSAVAQIKQKGFRVKQLEKSLKEIEEITIPEETVEAYRNARFRNIVIVSISLITGLLLLIFLIYHLTF